MEYRAQILHPKSKPHPVVTVELIRPNDAELLDRDIKSILWGLEKNKNVLLLTGRSIRCGILPVSFNIPFGIRQAIFHYSKQTIEFDLNAYGPNYEGVIARSSLPLPPVYPMRQPIFRELEGLLRDHVWCRRDRIIIDPVGAAMLGDLFRQTWRMA